MTEKTIDKGSRCLAPSFLPATAVMEMTYNCNHKCTFCSCPWYNESLPFEQLDEMTESQWKKLITKLSSMGVCNLAFTGGEPLLKAGIENIIEHAIVVCKDDIIGIEHLPEYLFQKGANLQKMGEKGVSWDDMERTFIFEALKKNHWNRAATAAQLGIHTTTLWRKMKRLRLDFPQKDGRTKNQ